MDSLLLLLPCAGALAEGPPRELDIHLLFVVYLLLSVVATRLPLDSENSGVPACAR